MRLEQQNHERCARVLRILSLLDLVLVQRRRGHRACEQLGELERAQLRGAEQPPQPVRRLRRTVAKRDVEQVERLLGWQMKISRMQMLAIDSIP